MVRTRVFPRKAKAIMRVGPRRGWNCGERAMPVPSRPNQIQSSHLQVVAQPALSSGVLVQNVGRWRRLDEPLQREEKAGEAPDGDESEAHEVLHHDVERDEDDECLCLGENGELESRELALMASSVLNRPLGSPAPAKDRVWSAVERVKSRNKDVCEEEQLCRIGVAIFTYGLPLGKVESVWLNVAPGPGYGSAVPDRRRAGEVARYL